MKLVAGATRPPPPFLVDMKVMKVPIAITEIREGACPLDGHGQILMAGEAEFVDIDIEIGIELRRKRFLEQAEVRASVGLVAAGAALLVDRLVPHHVLLQPTLHVDQLRISGLDRFVVAAKAEFLLRLEKIRLDIRRVGRVAVEAANFVERRSVVDCSGLRLVYDVVVALVAEFLPLRWEHEPGGTAVGVVTFGTAVCHRIVNELRFIDEFADLLVTISTEFYAFGEEQRGRG
jgi:hypothetical protein